MKKDTLDITTKLRQLRDKYRYSQQEIAQLLGVVQSTYAKIELGKSTIDFIQVSKLAKHYQVPIFEFLPSNYPSVPDIENKEVENSYIYQDQKETIEYLKSLTESLKNSNEKLILVLQQLAARN